jgi:hypothetical protein
MKEKLKKFSVVQIDILNDSVSMAEDLVSNFYKMSASQWLRFKYDIKTLEQLTPNEIVHGPFAQVIRYEGKRKNSLLGSSAYDLYKICLQDHSILSVIKEFSGLELFPLALYIVTHELIHVVRFGKFLQIFDASPEKRATEETRVHEKTHEILNHIQIKGLKDVLDFSNQRCVPFDTLS